MPVAFHSDATGIFLSLPVYRDRFLLH